MDTNRSNLKAPKPATARKKSVHPNQDYENLLRIAEERVKSCLPKIIAALQGHAHEVTHELKHDFLDILDPWSNT